MKLKSLALSICFLAMGLLVGCTDKETDLGIDLVDSTTFYHGHTDTLNADAAWNLFGTRSSPQTTPMES